MATLETQHALVYQTQKRRRMSTTKNSTAFTHLFLFGFLDDIDVAIKFRMTHALYKRL